MSQMDSIINALQNADNNLRRRLTTLTDDDKTALYNYISMFDADQSGTIDEDEVAVAASLLRLVRHIDQASLRDLNTILRLIDFNGNALVDHNERDLAVKILDLFSGEDAGDDNTLNHNELGKAVKAIRSFDRDDNGNLDKEERGLLKTAMNTPEHFKSLGN